ncbi:MAG: FG-GAP-like repeat-containing protein, partial [Flexibacteraceae bacterium]
LWSDNSNANTLVVSAAGTYSLRIRNTATGCTSAVSNAIVVSLNDITFTSFGSSTTSINSSLVINGTNLTGVTSVRFGETPASFTINSSTQITATVPRVANSGKVSFSNASGCSALSTSLPVTRESSLNLYSSVTANFNGIDVGFQSSPAFTDLDGDGLLDMLVGEQDGNLNHYEQNAANSTSFTLITATFNGINVGTRSAPTFTDLDGDGLLDMLVGENDGYLNHYEQSAANSTSFTLVNSTFNNIYVGFWIIPTFTDLDGDGLLDMLIGSDTGNLFHYEQNAANSTNFTFLTSSFNGIDIGFKSAPTFTDLDGDGLLDLLIGEHYGNLHHYEQNAVNSTSFTFVTTTFNSFSVGLISKPTFTDLDGDGLLDIIVGKSDGFLSHYEQNQLPLISSLSTNTTCQNTSVSITGTAFAGATSVTLNGLDVGTLSGITSTNINFIIPANATSGNVVVTTPNGTSNAVAITVNSPPTFSSFGSSVTSMNNNLVINGTDLTGITSVRFGETPAKFTVNSSTQITAIVPKVANTGKVSLLNSSGCSALSTSIPVTRQSTSNVFSAVTSTFNGINVGYLSAPAFTDLDGDGLLDMLIGEQDGNLNHYEQNAANSTSFILVTASFNGINIGTRSSPT